MVLQPTEERRRSRLALHAALADRADRRARPSADPGTRSAPNPTPEQILDLKVCDPAMGSGAFLVAACRFLAECWSRPGTPQLRAEDIPPDEDEILHARRLVAQRCLYGVDKNPMAVDLAKLSLWLATLAKDHPFTFLDHALRCGDSLVGLTRRRSSGSTGSRRNSGISPGMRSRGSSAGRWISVGRFVKPPTGRPRLCSANGFRPPMDSSNRAVAYGDLVVSAFFAGENDRKRKERLEALAADLAAQQSTYDVERFHRLDAVRRELRGGSDAPPPHTHSSSCPFHWEIEFPEGLTGRSGVRRVRRKPTLPWRTRFPGDLC